MFQVQCLKSKAEQKTELYSKYSIGPFVKGQSITVGNALRRVLLSNLQGLAITGIRITGIDHEFSTIPSVKEDVVDILLNLKQIILKGNIGEPVLARLHVKEPGIVTADNIELPNGITLPPLCMIDCDISVQVWFSDCNNSIDSLAIIF